MSHGHDSNSAHAPAPAKRLELPPMPELKISGPTFKVLAPLISVYCFQYSQAFRLCKAAGHENPSLCLAINRQLQHCTEQLFLDSQRIGCGELLQTAASCLNNNSLRLYRCPKELRAFETCFYKNTAFAPPQRQ